MTDGQEDTLKRWTAKRRVALVLELLRGDISVAEAGRKHGLTVAEMEQWKERFAQGAPAGAEHALRSKPLDEEAQQDQEIKRLKQNVGALVMDLDIMTEAVNGYPSLRQMSDA